MVKRLFILILSVLIFQGIQAQNLEGLSKQKPVLLSGGITARAIFYDANGIANRRQPFSYIFTGSPTISIFNSFTIPLSFTYSEQDRSFRQPFNQFGKSPYYKWITIHAGYRNINYSQFTIFRFGFISGRFNRATPVDTSEKSFQPYTYSNHGSAGKIGIGKGANFFEVSMLKANDDSSSVDGGESQMIKSLPVNFAPSEK